MEQASLSGFTVSCRTNDLSDNVEQTSKERLELCEAFSPALNESTDISDTAQLVFFIRTVTAGFNIAKEFLDFPPASFFSTTTGQYICQQALKVLEKFDKLCGVTTDGAPSMTDGTNKFTKKCGWNPRRTTLFADGTNLHLTHRDILVL